MVFFGQHNLKFQIADQENQPIVRAIIIVTQNDSQITFGTTNRDGFLEKTLIGGSYNVKVSKLGFIAETIVVDLKKNELIEVKLQTDTNRLETIIIKSRPKIMTVKQDTIQYNLKTIVDGTERKVEDVIKKLPGMQVDANGKVSYLGQEIDKVLVDGNELFGNKHQMATQNVNADMVNGIDLLTNYQGFSTSGSSSGAIVLNLKLKEGARGKIVGDIEANGGNNNAMLFHSNLFRFQKSGNLAIISDYNTTAKKPITVDDYREMRTPTNADSDSNGFTSFEMPKFLQASDFVKQKHNGFVGINYTNLISKKAKITFSNLFNNTDIVQQSIVNQSNVGAGGSALAFSSLKPSTSILSNSNFKIEFNKSKTTFWSYDFTLTPNNDLERNDIIKTSNAINSSVDNQNLSFAQTLKFNTTIFSKIKYRFQVFHNIVNNNQNIELQGSQPFFEINFANLNQNFITKTKLVAVTNKLFFKKNANTFSVNIVNEFLENQSTNLLKEQSVFNSNLQHNKSRFLTEFSWQRNWSSKFNTTLVGRSTTNNISLNNQSNVIARLESMLAAQYSFSAVNKFTFSANINHEFPTLMQLQNNSLIDDFQIIKRQSAVQFDQVIQKKNFDLDYFWLDLHSQSILFSKLSYSIQDNALATNVSYNPSFSENNFVLTPKNNQFRILTVYDLKMPKLPLSLKTTLVYLDMQAFTSFNNVLSKMSTETFSAKQQLFSNFKNSIFQFDFGFNFNKRISFQEISKFKNKAYNYQLIGTIKAKLAQKFKGDISFTHDFQNSGFATNTIYFLNSNLDYNFTKKLKVILTGFNLLNLKTSSIIRTSVNDNFFSESINSVLPGFLMIGMNYSF